MAMVETWRKVHSQIGRFRQLEEEHAPHLKPDCDVPKHYAQALCRLRHHVSQFLRAKAFQIVKEWETCTLMQPNWTLKFSDVAEVVDSPMTIENYDAARMVPTINEDGASKLLWLLRSLLQPPGIDTVSVGVLMDEIARLQDKDVKLAALISPRLERTVSDLAVLALCLDQIKSFIPSRFMHVGMVSNQSKWTRTDYEKTGDRLSRFSNSITKSTHLGVPTNGRFNYPDGKKRSRENVETMREAESALDEFWQAAFKELKTNGIMTPRIERILSERTVLRTPEWEDTFKKPVHHTPADLQMSLSELHLDLRQRTEQTLSQEDQVISKAKVKTRGSNESSSPDPPEDATQSANIQQDEFQVDRRAMRVFQCLFFDASNSSQRGELPWDSFVHAMCSIGFQAEQLYGSAWQFLPSKEMKVNRPIQFHQPHPHGKIPYIMGRRFGRRFNRAYGWHSGTFVSV